MLTRLANLGIRAPRRVLGLGGLLLVLAAVYGISAASHLSSGGFSDPNSPSSTAADVLDKTFHAGSANLILEVTSPDGANSAAARATGLRLVDAVTHAAEHQPGRVVLDGATPAGGRPAQQGRQVGARRRARGR